MSKNPTVDERDLTRRMSKLFKEAGKIIGEVPIDVSSLSFMADISMAAEGLRVSAQTRKSHLERNGTDDPDTTIMHSMLKGIEGVVDERLSNIIMLHPTAKWWSQVRGETGKGFPLQVMGKVIAEIEKFRKYYNPGDVAIPSYVTRAPEKVKIRVGEDDDGQPIYEEQLLVRVEGIERLTTVSKLYAYVGLTPDSKDKRGKGKTSSSNKDLRTMCFRLFQFGMLFTGNRYAERYREYKETKTATLTAAGVKIMPTPKGRFCSECAAEVTMKAARFCPGCNKPLSLKTEPDNVMFKGHLDAMARRWAVKLFLQHLWLVWRTELGLPTSKPYILLERVRLAERLGITPEEVTEDMLPNEHTTYITPDEMIRPEHRTEEWKACA